MKRFLQFFTMLPALILTLLLCNGCEEAGDEGDEIATYTVTFETNGGSYIASQNVKSGATIERPTDPIKDGYTFTGWYFNEGLTSEWDFAITINDNIKLYAKWIAIDPDDNSDPELDVVYYTVTFESNGGSSVEAQTVKSGSTIERPTDPTKSELIFGGWYIDVDCTQSYNFETIVTNNFILYARWTTVSYKVSFNTNGGSYIVPVWVAEGSAVSRPSSPTLTGYTFDDWYNSDKLLTLWDFSTLIFEDITLYANWYKSPIITFDSNGGSTVESQVIDYNSSATEPSAPIRTNYTFGGWYADLSFTSKWDFTTNITNDMSLYAKWILIEGELPSMDSDSLL